MKIRNQLPKPRIICEDEIISLSFDGIYYQSKINARNPLKGHCEYIELFLLSLLFNPNPRKILALGLGGGSIQRVMHHLLPDAKIISIEINPSVVELAEKHFGFNSVALPVVISDAREHIEKSKAKYDIIIQDTYISNSRTSRIPDHLATKEYFQLIRKRLRSDGVFAINVLGNTRTKKNTGSIGSLFRTIYEVFPEIYNFEAKETNNTVFIVPRKASGLTSENLKARAKNMKPLFAERVKINIEKLVSTSFRKDIPPHWFLGKVYSDNEKPVDEKLR